MNQINKETNSKRKVVRLLVQVPKLFEKHFSRICCLISCPSQSMHKKTSPAPGSAQTVVPPPPVRHDAGKK